MERTPGAIMERLRSLRNSQSDPRSGTYQIDARDLDWVVGEAERAARVDTELAVSERHLGEIYEAFTLMRRGFAMCFEAIRSGVSLKFDQSDFMSIPNVRKADELVRPKAPWEK